MQSDPSDSPPHSLPEPPAPVDSVPHHLPPWEHPDAHSVVGTPTLCSGEHVGADDRPPTAGFLAALAEVYLLLGRLDRAADCCLTALRLHPDTPQTALRLRRVARACYRELLRRHPTHTAETLAWYERVLRLDSMARIGFFKHSLG